MLKLVFRFEFPLGTYCINYNVTFETDILVNSGPEFLPNLAEVRPNGSAEPSVEMAEPFGLGRTTFFAVRSYTRNSSNKNKKC